jgi:multiple sugar transport system substrate-binding protein
MVQLRALRLAMVALMLAGGCSAAPKDPGGGPVTIVWWTGRARWGTNDVRLVLRDAFERAYPSIKVRIVTGPDSTDRQHDALIRALEGDTPDVYSGDVVWPYEFASRGLALPLDKYLPPTFWSTFAAPGTPPSQYAPVQAVTYRGGIYAVPYFVDKGFLYYRKDLLAQAKRPPPTTWKELREDSRILKSMGLPYQYVWQGNDYEGLTCVWTEMLADAYGDDGLPPDTNIAAALVSPQAVRALNFLRQLISEDVSPSDTNALEEPDGDRRFDGGQVAFLRGWDSSYGNALGFTVTGQVVDPDNVGVVPPPTFSGQPGPGWSALGGWSLFVNPRSKHRAEDLTFIQWVAGVQAQRILATHFSQIPSNYAVSTDPTIQAKNPVMAAAENTRLVIRPAATTKYPQITQAIHSHIHAALPSPSPAGTGLLPGNDPCQELRAAAVAIDPHVQVPAQFPSQCGDYPVDGG